MHLRESQLTRNSTLVVPPLPAQVVNRRFAQERAPTKSPPLLLAILQKHAPLLLLAGVASLAVAYFASGRLSSESSVTYAALMHTGLPGGTGQSVYEPLSAKTCSELLTSSTILEETLNQRGLDMPATSFAELITVQQTRSSSLLGIELAWKNAGDGIAILDTLLDVFIGHVADIRRKTLSDYRKKHVELELFEARATVDNLRSNLRELQRQQQESIDEEGPSSELYRGLLADVSNTQLSIDEKNAQLLGIQRQIRMLESKADALEEKNREVVATVRRLMIGAASTQLATIKQGYAESSDAHQNVQRLVEEITRLDDEDATTPSSLDQFRTQLLMTISSGPSAVSQLDQEAISIAVDAATGQWVGLAKEVADDLRVAKRQLEDRALAVIPVEDQITMLQARRLAYQEKADDVGEQITGVESTRFDDLESKLAEAEFRSQELAKQHDSMQQLERCVVSEWSKETPPSQSTTQVSSNNLKVFALAFVLCGLVVGSPLLLMESISRRPSPQSGFASDLRLPLIAEQLLGNLASGRNRIRRLEELNDEQTEAVRRLALRLQQSTANTSAGAAVVFSGADASVSSMPLIAVVSQCLAERGERVLVIDTVSTGRSAIDLANVLGPGIDQKNKTKAKATQTHEENPGRGLAEYLAAECDDMAELIQPTGQQGIDMISGGEQPFAREAMASGSLTRLIDACRDRYTMILVNAPSTDHLADLQLIAARADGVVISVTKSSANNPNARYAVHDMIDLQSPIIGVVS